MEYELLSSFYDEFVNADYAAMARLYEQLWARFRFAPELVLDLGCGTGNLLPYLEKGRQVIGVDVSPEMLAIAREKASPQTLLLCQDMTQLDLYGTIDAVVCELDCINALPEEDAVRQTFERVNLFLSRGGLFIFDVNAPKKFETVLDGRAFVYESEDVFLVWESEYDKEKAACDFLLTFFLRREDGSYAREEERMTQRVYSKERLLQLMEESGLEPLTVCNGAGEEPEEEELRLFFVARKGKDAPNQ